MSGKSTTANLSADTYLAFAKYAQETGHTIEIKKLATATGLNYHSIWKGMDTAKATLGITSPAKGGKKSGSHGGAGNGKAQPTAIKKRNVSAAGLDYDDEGSGAGEGSTAPKVKVKKARKPRPRKNHGAIEKETTTEDVIGDVIGDVKANVKEDIKEDVEEDVKGNADEDDNEDADGTIYENYDEDLLRIHLQERAYARRAKYFGYAETLTTEEMQAEEEDEDRFYTISSYRQG